MSFPALRLSRRSRGAALIEYGILVGLVSLVSISSVVALGNQVQTIFGGAANAVSDPVTVSVVEDPTAEAPVGEELFKARWSMTPGTYSSGARGSNFPHTDQRYEFGIISHDASSVWRVLQQNTYQANSYLIIADNRISEIPAYGLQCEGGEFFPFSAASASVVPVSNADDGSEKTIITWTSGGQTYNGAGPYDCQIVPVE